MDLTKVKTKTLFLKWCLLNILALIFLAYIGEQYAGRLHGPALIAVPVILAAYVWTQRLAGVICWQADDPSVPRALLLHKVKGVFHWIEQCQYLAMLSTVFGIFLLLTDTSGNLHDRLLKGGGVAFSATFVGIFASLILNQVRRLIENELEY